MRNYTRHIKDNKELLLFIASSNIDKALIFLVPLSILFFYDNYNSYNDVEYIYGIANMVIPLFSFLSTYGFYSYKESTKREEEREKYIMYSSLLILLCYIVMFLLFIINSCIEQSKISNLILILVSIRTIYLLYISNYSTYYRLIDIPSKILGYSIFTSLLTLFLLFITSYIDNKYILASVFLPQLLLTLKLKIYGGIRMCILNFVTYLKKALIFSLPIIINAFIVAFVMNYGKVYAYNKLSEYDMYCLSFILRISMIVSMMSSSLIAFYSKNIYLNGYTKNFIIKYSIFMCIAFISIILFLFVYNIYSEKVITINMPVVLILLYSAIHSISSVFDSYFGRNNKNHIILIVSTISCIVYVLFLTIIDKITILTISLSMISYIISYLVIIILYILCQKSRKVAEL